MRTPACLAFALAIGASCFPAEKEIATFVSPGSPWGIWRKSYGRRFPVEIIVRDLADLGVTDIYFPDQNGRGGPFLHPTKVQYAKTHGYLLADKRDYLREILEQARTRNMRVWLMWTTPGKNYPDTDIHGLNDPRMIKLYCDAIEEVARNYREYENLVGVYWHELDCTEAPDTHEDDVPEFAAFCEREFGEAYTGDVMPPVEPTDVWWRRHFLYRIHVMNSFVRETEKVADRHGLKTSFCTYTAEAYSGAGWRWGYDTVELEKLCHRQWFAGYSVESRKPYQSVKGAWIDFGPSYRGQILPRNYSYAFHGKPLSYFEYRAPIYIKEMRKYYSSIKRFDDKYGDIYTGYRGSTEQEVSLFFGKQNFASWLSLINWWQGGTSPARIAVAVNVTPFIMKHPVATGVAHKKRVNDLMVDGTRYADLDGLLLGSEFTLSPENLRQYSLIIVPEDMGDGLSQAMADSLRQFVQGGGRLLVIATPLRVTRRDLTNPRDLTGELCGVRFRRPGLPGYAKLSSSVLPVPEKKLWAGSRPSVEVTDARVLVTDAFSGAALLTQKGSVYFSSLGYASDGAAYFQEVITHICTPPIALRESQGLRILETVQKGNAVCVALWGPGSAKLRVDAVALGLAGPSLEAKDIVTGRMLCEGSAGRPSSGIPIEIEHVNQPCIVAIGPPDALRDFGGIYDSPNVFKGLTERRTLENPEVVIQVPEGPGVKVGVYHGSFGATALIGAISRHDGFCAFSLPRLDEGALAKSDVVVISKTAATVNFKHATKLLRTWAQSGGRLLLCFDAVGYRAHPAIFPELGQGYTNPKGDVVTIAAAHPVTKGFETGDEFVHAYADHVEMTKGERGRVLVVDEKGQPVVIVGTIGKGRVVLNGMITGYASVKRGEYAGSAKEPEGDELKLLHSMIRWLSEK